MYAIIYESNTGHTETYARILGEKVNAAVYSLHGAKRTLAKGEKVFFMGWVCADTIKGYQAAQKRFDLCGVCAVGMTPAPKADLAALNKKNEIGATPFFYLQGGMDPVKLNGIYKKMISLLTSSLEKADKNGSLSPEKQLQLSTLKEGCCCNDKEDMETIVTWWSK